MMEDLLTSTLGPIICIALAAQNGPCKTGCIFLGLYCYVAGIFFACFVLQHLEVAMGCGQSHPLEPPQTRSALSVFRSAGINHQAGDEVCHAISAGLLAW